MKVCWWPPSSPDRSPPPPAARRWKSGLIVNAPAADVLRLAPSLLVSDAEIDRALATLGRVLDLVAAKDGSDGR